jgi:hypothetical protein
MTEFTKDDLSEDHDSVEELFDYFYSDNDWKNEDYLKFDRLLAQETLHYPPVKRILNGDWALNLLYYVIVVGQITNNGYSNRKELTEEVFEQLYCMMIEMPDVRDWPDWDYFWQEDIEPPLRIDAVWDGIMEGFNKETTLGSGVHFK